jgi:hypothetical protein
VRDTAKLKPNGKKSQRRKEIKNRKEQSQARSPNTWHLILNRVTPREDQRGKEISKREKEIEVLETSDHRS